MKAEGIQFDATFENGYASAKLNADGTVNVDTLKLNDSAALAGARAKAIGGTTLNALGGPKIRVFAGAVGSVRSLALDVNNPTAGSLVRLGSGPGAGVRFSIFHELAHNGGIGTGPVNEVRANLSALRRMGISP